MENDIFMIVSGTKFQILKIQLLHLTSGSKWIGFIRLVTSPSRASPSPITEYRDSLLQHTVIRQWEKLKARKVEYGIKSKKNCSNFYTRQCCIYSVSQKKCHLFYICHNLVRYHPLVKTYPRKFDTNTVCTADCTSFYMFVLYLVKTSNNFYGI